MSTRPTPRRTRLLALTASGALLLAAPGLAAVAVSPAAAAPAGDCAVAYPVAEVTDGQAVTGQTVVRGTTPTGFTGEVLGVLDDGIAPGLDMIVVDLDMPEFAQTGGVWAGMSGSPVYAADGRLLGAVAYGLAYGASPIAGVTPFEEMDDRLGAVPATKVGVSGKLARDLAAEAGTSLAQAQQGFDQLPVPTTVSGVDSRRVAQVRERAGKRTRLAADTHIVGAAAAAPAAGPETIVAGGNLAASASYGDILIGGVGTTTSVCGDRVVGFGHPAFFGGATTLGLHPASSLFIQPDSLGVPFKVANISGPAGTITDDRLAGITGTLGALPRTATVTSRASYEGRSRTGSSEVVQPDFLADTTLLELFGNLDRVIDGINGGSALQGWRISGTNRGKAFSLGFTDRYTSGFDISGEATFGLADVVFALSELEGVAVDDVAVTTTADASEARYDIKSVQQRRKGKWVTVSRKVPVVARGGQKVQLRLLLGGTGGARTVAVPALKIPKRARGSALLSVQGGNDAYTDLYGSSLAGIAKKVAQAQRHDEISVELGTPDKVDFGGGFGDEEFFFFRGKAGKGAKPGKGSKPGKPGKPGKGGRQQGFATSRVLGPLDHVVGGSRLLTVRIR